MSKTFRAGNRVVFDDPTVRFRVVGCDKLNLREKASKDSKILRVLDKGDIVFGVSSTGLDWKRVVYDPGKMDIKGYCMTEFLEEVSNDSDNS